MPKVIWLKPVRTQYRKSVQRIEATLIAADEDYRTVELNDVQRCAVQTEQVKLVKAAQSS
jgi:hypothetical protein